ncbi:MAG: sulfotransferase, partial [Gammaproteobacteria bacterium]|nr:sulfotransferase [Gammaproteobacteria bacterium]
MNKRIQEILQLAQSGQLTDALKKCERLIKKKPGDVNFLLVAASLYAQSNQYEKIIDYCLRAIRIEPKNTSALYNLGVAYLFLKDYENTIKYTLPLIKLDNKHANAYANLGLAYWHTGDLENAEKNALIALKLAPAIATNHNNIGLIYKSLKEIDKAISHFKQAITLNPQLAEAYYNYGTTLHEMGDEQGNSLIDKALLIKPDYSEVLNYKGLKFLETNQTIEAIEYFKKAIVSQPDYAEAYCNLGNAFMSQKEFASAETMYRKAIEHNPQFASAYNNLGNALLNQDTYKQYYDEAEQAYFRAIELAPEMNDTYKNLAVCYQGEGFQDKALYYFKIYNERVPDDEIAIAGMATVYERDGKYDEAMELLKPLILNDNVSTDIVLAYAKLAKYFKYEDEAIQALTNINDDDIPNKFKVEKYFTLGKLTESNDNADIPFNYYKKANDLEEEKHDLEHDKGLFNNVKTYFSKDKIEHLQRSKNNSRLPIFIVGMPRSGTSLAEQILASHPDVFGAGELENIELLVNKIKSNLETKKNYPLCLDNMSSDYATKMAEDHIETLSQMAPDASYIVDKMPHNFLGLGEINLLFPKATVIHCRRSSIDTCLSIYFQRFNKDHSYSNNLEMLGQYYNLYADLMQHWKQTLDINLIELEYEKVIAAPEEEMRNLLDRCGIDWDPACLKFHENKRTVMTP